METDAEIEAVVEQRRGVRLGGVGEIGRDAAAGAEQRGGLAADHVEVIIEREIGAAVLFLSEDLALDHADGHVRQQAQNLEIPLGQRHAHRMHEDVVADKDGEIVAPAIVDGRAAAADLRLVDDVVVHQRGGVNELDDRAVDDVAVALVAQHLRDEQQQGRAEALAAAGQDVIAHVADGRNLRLEVAPQLVLDELQFRRDGLEEALHARELLGEGRRIGQAHGWQG